jgi:hypothetical protein
LKDLDLPERLVDAIIQARGITAHEGRRRQIQYIGKLMRTIDPAPLQAALAAWAKGPREENARFAAIERWRDRLLVDPAALNEFVGAYPQADRRHWSPSSTTPIWNGRVGGPRTATANCFAAEGRRCHRAMTRNVLTWPIR